MNDDATLPKKKGVPWGWAAAVIAVISLVAVGSYFRGTNEIISKQARADADIRTILALLQHYVAEYGTPPVGDNAAVSKALSGENPRQIILIAKGASITANARREILDPWGHPYHIDTSNPKALRVYSFGKNGIDEGGAEGSDDVVSWR